METTTEPQVTRAGRGVAPGLLELMGKQASRMYLEKGVGLNDAIVKLASESQSDLHSEHLRRVAEFANTETHQTLFTKSADKVFAFPLADAEQIIQNMHDGAGTRIPTISPESAVRSAMPKVAKAGFIAGMDSHSLEEGFGKASSERYPDHNPYGSVMKVLDYVKTAQEELDAKRTGLGIMLLETEANLMKQIKQASLYGFTLADLDGALGQVAQHGPTQKYVIKQARVKLADEPHFQKQDQGVKIASGILNTEHPLVQSYLLYESLAKKERIFEKAAAKLSVERTRFEKVLHDKLGHAQRDLGVQSSAS